MHMNYQCNVIDIRVLNLSKIYNHFKYNKFHESK